MKKENNKGVIIWIMVISTVILGSYNLIFQPVIKTQNTYGLSAKDYKNYVDSIKNLRQKAIKEFSNIKTTPLDSVTFKNSFKPPKFFPLNLKYRVKAHFTVDTSGPVFGMATNTKRKPKYRVYGYLDFTINDTAQRLTAYQNVNFINDPEYGKFLFVPFRDKTNTYTTYGAGRYLDILIPDTDTIILDFNTAYNPYCAYSDRWSCPLVPFENWLEVSIEAGEMKYSDHH